MLHRNISAAARRDGGCTPDCLKCRRARKETWATGERGMDRRKFFGLSAAAGGLLAAGKAGAQPSGLVYGGRMDVQAPLVQQQQFRIGYTTNTRGGWEGSPFVGISQDRQLG